MIKKFIFISYLLIFLFSGLYFFYRNQSLLLLGMWIPTFSVLILGKEQRIRLIQDLKIFSLKGVLLGISALSLVSVLNHLIMGLFLTAKENPSLIQWNSHEGLILLSPKMSLLLGSGPQGLPFFILNLGATLAVATILSGLLGGLGEEIGWRGFLQRALNKKMGVLKAPFFVGLIWAFWHTGLNLQGLNGKSHLLLLSLVFFPISVIGLSYFFSLLFERFGLWACAFVHGYNNVISDFNLVSLNNSLLEMAIKTFGAAFLGLVSFYFIRHDFYLKEKNDEKHSCPRHYQ